MSRTSPLASYRAAQRAIKAFARGNDTDAAALAALAGCIASVTAAHPAIAASTKGWDAAPPPGTSEAAAVAAALGASSCHVRPSGGAGGSTAAAAAGAAAGGQQPLVSHSVDLSLSDDPAFLAASALLSLGTLREMRGPDGRALEAAEQHLARAIEASEALAAADDGLAVEASKACAREATAGGDARRALAMLLCQAGGREAEAAAQLWAVGFSWRLAPGVLCYPLGPSDSSSSGTSSSSNSKGRLPLAVLDGALPGPLLRALQAAFAPAAPFWGAHGYGPRQGYFSYMFPLNDGSAPDSLLSQLAHRLRDLAAPHFPDVREAAYAEWWAHCRRHCSGHQLHFDSDDEGIGGVRNPIISSVVYLSSAPSADTAGHGGSAAEAAAANGSSGGNAGGGVPFVGGPTLVTDQRLGGPLATKGWLAYPAVNRVTFFDGQVLHGVIPGRGPSPDPTARRCTLMVAFWRDLRCRPCADNCLGASMPMPDPAAAGDDAPWLSMLAPLADAGASSSSGGVAAPALVPPTPVAEVWAPVDGAGARKAPTYDACFQGF